MPDIFDDIKAGRAAQSQAQAPRVPPSPSGGDIFDQIKASKTATAAAAPPGPLTVNSIPAKHVAMTDAAGNLQAIPETQVAGMMQKGFKLGPPQQQDPTVMQQAWKNSVTDPLAMLRGAASETGGAIKGLGHTLFDPMTEEEKASPLGLSGTPVARMGKAYIAAVQENAEKAKQAGEQGRPGKVMGRSIAAGLPLLGPLVGRAMDIGEDVEQGKMSGAESAGRGLSLVGQVASGSPKIAGAMAKAGGAAGKVAGAVGQEALQAAKIKALPASALNPAEQLAKTAGPTKMMAVHGAAKIALPEIQQAAEGMGQPAIQTIDQAVAAAKQAKTNLAIEAQAKMDAQGGGKTLADAPEEYHARVKAIDTVQDHLENLAKRKADAIESAAKASKNTPATRGEAAGVLAKGMAKSAVGGGTAMALNSAIPGAGTVVHAGLDAVGLGMGGKDLAAGMRGLIKPSGVGVADALDSSVAGAFKPAAPPMQMPMGQGQPPLGPDPFATPPGPVDPRVQAQPPAFTRPESASVGKVARPDPVIPPPSEPYVSPRMAKLKAEASATETKPAAESQAQTPASGFPKATAEGYSSPNPPRSNLAKNQKQMAKWGIKLPENPSAPPSGVKGSLDQFEKQYKGQYTETNGTVDAAGLLKKIGADDVIPRDKVAHIEKAWRAGEKVEPVKLYVDENNNILGADGRHRAQAAVNAGVKKIPIIVRRVKIK